MTQAGVFSMCYPTSSIKICLDPKLDHLKPCEAIRNLKLKMSSIALKKKNLRKNCIKGKQVISVKNKHIVLPTSKVTSKRKPLEYF